MTAIHRTDNSTLEQFLRAAPLDRISSLGDYREIRNEVRALDITAPDARSLLEKVVDKLDEKIQELTNNPTPHDTIAVDWLTALQLPAAPVVSWEVIFSGISIAACVALTSHEVMHRNTAMAATMGGLATLNAAAMGLMITQRLRQKRHGKYEQLKAMRPWLSKHRNEARRAKILLACFETLVTATDKLNAAPPPRPQKAAPPAPDVGPAV